MPRLSLATLLAVAVAAAFLPASYHAVDAAAAEASSSPGAGDHSSSSSSSPPPLPTSPAIVVDEDAPLDDQGPDLFELHPGNYASTISGQREGLIVVAFVHPMLEKSADLHPILHRLHQHYTRRNNAAAAATTAATSLSAPIPRVPHVRIAFADVHRHRSFFVPRFAFKALPQLLAFSRGPNMDLAPVSVLYAENRTFAEYRREIDLLAASTAGMSSLAKSVVDRAAAVIDATLVREAEAAGAAANAKAKKGDKTAAAATVTVAEVTQDGGVVHAAGEGNSTTNSTEEASTPLPLPLLSAEEHAAALQREHLRDLEAEIQTEMAALDAARLNLAFVLSTLKEMTQSDAGVGHLAHVMNRVRAQMLTSAASTPLDAQLLDKSAAERRELIGKIAVLTDLFASTASAREKEARGASTGGTAAAAGGVVGARK